MNQKFIITCKYIFHMKKLIFIFFLSIQFSFFSFGNTKTETDSKITNLHIWMNEVLDLTKNCVGFSAPVSSRAFAYFTFGIYESSVESSSEYQSLSGQINGYNRNTWKRENEKIYWPEVINRTAYQMVNFLFANMPEVNKTKVSNLYLQIKKTNLENTSKSELSNSIDYADKISKEIIEWTKNDGGHEAYKYNFPKTYNPPVCESCWVITYPDYLPAQLPYWGNRRLLINSNRQISDDIKVFDFSTDTVSVLYKNALEIYDLNKSKIKEYEIIAKYWDDSPGYSGTPAGHQISLALQLAEQSNFTYNETIHLLTLLSFTIHDAFIECWRLKYTFNFIRPITYIHRYIAKDFNSIISSPPFPEFPSGHSYQSGAGNEVLKYFFSDTVKIIDSTNAHRIDIDGHPRSYNNLTELAEETSMSRLYGGIHYRYTLIQSLEYGRRIGKNTIMSLNFKK